MEPPHAADGKPPPSFRRSFLVAGAGAAAPSLEIRLFYVRISPCAPDSVPPHLTLSHALKTPNPSSSSPSSLSLRRDRLDPAEVTYTTTDSLRLSSPSSFTVSDDRGHPVLLGSLDRALDLSHHPSPSDASVSAGWAMDCCTAGAVEDTAFVRGLSGPPSFEVYVAGCAEGRPLVLTQTVHLAPRRKAARTAGGGDEGAEDDEAGLGRRKAPASAPMTSTQPAPLKRTVTATWTNEQENIYLDILVKRVKRGEMATSAFSKKDWKEIKNDFFKISKKSYDFIQLKNKYNKFRQRYKNFKALVEQPGFKWDSIINGVTADDVVWDDYIKANPDAKVFRAKGCPGYPKLCIVYGDTTLVEARACLLNQELEADTPSLLDEEVGDSSDDVCETQVPTTPLTCGPTSVPGTSNTTSHRVLRSLSGVETNAEAMMTIGNARFAMNATSCTPIDDPYSMENCMKILKEMDELESIEMEKLVMAAERLKEPSTREMFELMNSRMRKCWVEKMP